MLEKFENNVKLYTTSVKDKLLVINGAAVTVGKKHNEDISAIYELISGLDSSYAAYVDDHEGEHYRLSKVAEDVDASIAEMKTSIVQLDNKIYEKIEEQAESATAEFTNINTSIENIIGKISGLDSSVSSVETSIAELISKHDYDISTIRRENDLNTAVQFASLCKTIDASFVEHMGYIHALDSSVSGLETTVTEVNDRIDGLDSSVSALETSIAELESNVNDRLDTSVAAIETSIAELESKHDYDISTLHNRIQSEIIDRGVNFAALIKCMDASFAEHMGYINTLDASVAALESDMTEANTRIDGLDSSIRAQNMQIGVNYATLIKCIDASFAEHLGYINTLNSSVAALETDVTDLYGRIDGLDSSVAALETKHDEDLAVRDTSITEILTLLGTATDSSTEPTIYGLFAKLNHIIEENEEIVAQALVDMDQRINNL